MALLFYPLPGEDLCLRASYKSISRMPTFNDLYYREVGNYKLAPEKSKQWNIGAAYSMRPTTWCSQLTFTADAYHGKVEDKIVAVPNVFMWKMSNVDRVEILGADVCVKAIFPFIDDTRMNLAATYSYMRAVNRTKGSQLYGHRIVYTPLHSGSADLSLNTPIADVGYTLLWSDSRYHLAQNIPSNEIKAYADHSLWLSRCWNIGNYTLLAKAEVKNIGDKNYEIIRYYPMPGRNYALTFILTL
jgi:outer membrane cobalamin receptor